MNFITKNKQYTDDEKDIILYGLESLYLTYTKMMVIFLLAFLLGCLKETIILLITYNIIRAKAFGIHATKSIYCLISSILIFIGGALICKYITLPLEIMVIVAIICDICLLLFAPADTHKHPLINAKKRKKFKFISFSLGIIYTILIVVLKDYFIVNYLLFGLIFSVIMVLPITYKIFKLPYNNYKNYNYGV